MTTNCAKGTTGTPPVRSTTASMVFSDKAFWAATCPTMVRTFRELSRLSVICVCWAHSEEPPDRNHSPFHRTWKMRCVSCIRDWQSAFLM